MTETELTAFEELTKAKNILWARKWAAGSPLTDNVLGSTISPCCALTALAVARYGDQLFDTAKIYEQSPGVKVLARAITSIVPLPENKKRDPYPEGSAISPRGSTPETIAPETIVWRWNDELDRTLEQVIEVFDLAIEIA